MHNAALGEGKDRMIILPLKQGWREADGTLVQPSIRSLNQKGLHVFCQALDQTVRFADTKIMRNHGIPLNRVFQKDKLQQEMEKRITDFENTRDTNSSTHQRRNMMQQQQYRQQYQQVRRFFNERRHLDNRCHHHKPGCKKQLFKKD